MKKGEELAMIYAESDVAHALADRIGQGWAPYGFGGGFSFHAGSGTENLSSRAVLDLLQAFGIACGWCGQHQHSIAYVGTECPVCKDWRKVIKDHEVQKPLSNHTDDELLVHAVRGMLRR